MIVNSSLPAQPELIPGIYNYCDSWCERCALTSKCRSFQLQQQRGLAKPDPNASLIDQLTEALNLTKRYIEGLQPITPPTMPSSEEQSVLEEAALKRYRCTKDHSAAALATAYLKLTGTWLSNERKLLEQAGHEQLLKVELGICTEDEAMLQLNALKDACEQIRWYRTLIPVKTNSALRVINEHTDNERLLSYYNGKAKLVLVSIDRSLTAWQTVMTYHPDVTDDLLGALSLLNQLSRQIQFLFPNAQAFQRPGLD